MREDPDDLDDLDQAKLEYLCDRDGYEYVLRGMVKWLAEAQSEDSGEVDHARAATMLELACRAIAAEEAKAK